MNYNNYFPANYAYFQPQMQNQQYQQQTNQMSPPTIHAEIIQINGEQEVKDYPVAAGCTQMFMSKDDTSIFIKSAYANQPAQIVRYNKIEPIIENPPDYVTKDELDKRLNEIMNKIRNNNQNKKQEGVKNG